MPKQISIYAIDSNGYYSDSVSVDLVLPKSQPVTIEYKNQEGATLKASAKIEKNMGKSMMLKQIMGELYYLILTITLSKLYQAIKAVQ